MQDRPDAPELAAAIAGFLRDEVLPQLADERTRFRLRVALNGLAMLERELRDGGRLLAEELALLSDHLDLPVPTTLPAPQAASLLNAALAERLRAGETGPPTLALLQRLSELKLAVASPRTLQRYQEGPRP